MYCTAALLGISKGTGKKRYLISDYNLPIAMKWWWICHAAYIITDFFVRMSIGIFLLRIAAERAHRLIILGLLIVMQLYCTYFFFLFICQCWPVKFFWERLEGGSGTCVPTKLVVSKPCIWTINDPSLMTIK
jgi:hypothetical protein